MRGRRGSTRAPACRARRPRAPWRPRGRAGRRRRPASRRARVIQKRLRCMATSSAPPRSSVSTRLKVSKQNESSAPETSTTSGASSSPTSSTPVEVLGLRVAEEEDAGARALLAQPGARQHRRRQDVVVGEREPGLAQHRAEARRGERRGVGEHAQGHAGGVQARDRRRRSGQRRPRHAEHAVHVEQQSVDAGERGHGPSLAHARRPTPLGVAGDAGAGAGTRTRTPQQRQGF